MATYRLCCPVSTETISKAQKKLDVVSKIGANQDENIPFDFSYHSTSIRMYLCIFEFNVIRCFMTRETK